VNVRTHAVPRKVLAALASGGGGVEAIRHLRDAERSRTRLLVRDLVERAREVRHPHAEATGRAFAVLVEVERIDADVVSALLTYPAVSAWAVHTVDALHGPHPERANPGFLAALTASAAVRAGHRTELDLPAHPAGDRHVALPLLGWYDRRHPGWHAHRRVEVTHGGLRLAADLETAAWQHALGATHCRDRGVLDVDPDAEPWRDGLAAAWALLVEHHRDSAQELAEAVSMLVPLAEPPSGATSSTFASAFGAVAMSTPRSARSTALALVHEIQHSKFAALTQLYDLVDDEPRCLYYAPWRTDPRPLSALLDGTYAFLGVARFWRAQRLVDTDEAARDDAETNFRRWTRAAHDVAEMMVRHSALTAAGRFVAGHMLGVLREWLREPVSGRADATAYRLARDHLDQWRRSHAHSRSPWWCTSTLIACPTR
jgi:hypothetical protein